MHELELVERRARTPHQCAWCKEQISPGDHYLHWVYIFDGFTVEDFHPECFTALQAFVEDPDEPRCGARHQRGQACHH